MQFGVKMRVSLKCTTSSGPNSYVCSGGLCAVASTLRGEPPSRSPLSYSQPLQPSCFPSISELLHRFLLLRSRVVFIHHRASLLLPVASNRMFRALCPPSSLCNTILYIARPRSHWGAGSLPPTSGGKAYWGHVSEALDAFSRKLRHALQLQASQIAQFAQLGSQSSFHVNQVSQPQQA